jgi:hypothetical protein
MLLRVNTVPCKPELDAPIAWSPRLRGTINASMGVVRNGMLAASHVEEDHHITCAPSARDHRHSAL